MASNFASSDGYSLEILDRKDQDVKYTCTYCKMLLKDPHQSQCGHRFCRPCIDVLIRDTGLRQCPLCEPDEDPELSSIVTTETIFRDNAIKREMKRLNTKCINEGCHWTGKFEHYESHITECQDAPVECEFCGQKVSRKKILEHTDVNTGDCPKKMQRCEFHAIGCNKMVEIGKEKEHNTKYIEDHLEMLYQQVATLLNLRSSLNENESSVKQINATVQKQRDVIANLQRSLKRIEDDLQDQPRQAESQLSDRSLKDFHTVIERLSKSNRDFELKHKQLDGKIATYANVVGLLNHEVEKSADQVQALVGDDRIFRNRLDVTEKKAKAQDRIIALKDVTLAEQDLRIQSLEMASYDGILTWKISEFGRKKRDAISGRTLSLYSPYFFTSRFGYKMCARIYLNGDGMGKGNHISLFFVIMKGEFDAILKWPFRQKVTLMWIDQNNREHMIDAFRPDPSSSSFKRPTGDMNIASGCPLFMPLSMLESSSHAYVKDNTAFLRVIVDTHDL